MMDEESLQVMDEAELKDEVKKLVADERFLEALKIMELIASRFPSEKHSRRLEKFKEYVEHQLDDESEEDISDESLDESKHKLEGLEVHPKILDKLYPYQVDGIKWLWELFKKRKGGILGDDMGMGKTVQVSVFLSTVIKMDKIKSALIVMPVSLIATWENELGKWAPNIDIMVYHDISKSERERLLRRVQKRGGVMLTTYGLVVASVELRSGHQITWDYVILDEGHKIKNVNKANKGAHEIPAKNRIVLTGTPIQNDLNELWALFDFVHHGTLLGTRKTFKLEYADPIKRSREKCASARERVLGNEIAESLKSIIAPYFLRRTKDGLKEAQKDKAQAGGDGHQLIFPSLGEKNELMVWIRLTELQIKLYRSFLTTDAVKEALMATRSPLVKLIYLKKICDHPRLIANYSYVIENIDQTPDDIVDGIAEMSMREVPIAEILEASNKMKFVLDLCLNLRAEGHRTLIFSQSRKILDMIERILRTKNFKMLRIDGRVLGSERDNLVQKFQKDSSVEICLLTVQVGGVGLTLTAADRVIIYDPSWNPGTDAQAVDRVYRIGQKKPVIVYRLVTCGTVEEKIYRRQVFKTSITERMVGKNPDPFRYFTQQEIRELFHFGDPMKSDTHFQLSELHSRIEASREVNDHMEFLKTLDILGLSHHTLMFSDKSQETGCLGDDEKLQIARILEQAALKVNLESQMNLQCQGTRTNVHTSEPALGNVGFARPVRPEPQLVAKFALPNYELPNFPRSERQNLPKNVQPILPRNEQSTFVPRTIVHTSTIVIHDDSGESGLVEEAGACYIDPVKLREMTNADVLPVARVTEPKEVSAIDDAMPDLDATVDLGTVAQQQHEDYCKSQLDLQGLTMVSPGKSFALKHISSTPAHGSRPPIVDPISPDVIQDSLNALSIMDVSSAEDGILETGENTQEVKASDTFESDNAEIVNNPIQDTSSNIIMETCSSDTSPSNEYFDLDAFND